VIAQRHAERETVVEAVPIDFAQVIIDAAGPQHRPGDAGVDGQFGGQHSDALQARQDDFIAGHQGFEFVQEPRKLGHQLFRLLEPAFGKIDTAAAKAQVIAHHPRAAQCLEQIQDFFAFAKGIHQGRAHGAEILQQKTDQAGMVLQAGQFAHDDANVLRALGHLQAGELFQDFTKAISEDTDHFLGTIVTIPRGNATLEVVDGQQRLATTALLLAAIRDNLEAVEEDVLVESINNVFLTGIVRRERARVPRLKLNIDDNDLFKAIVSGTSSAALPQPTLPSHQRLIDAYRGAQKHIRNIVSPLDNKEHGDLL